MFKYVGSYQKDRCAMMILGGRCRQVAKTRLGGLECKERGELMGVDMLLRDGKLLSDTFFFFFLITLVFGLSHSKLSPYVIRVQRPNGRDVKSAVVGARSRDGMHLSRGYFTTRPRGQVLLSDTWFFVSGYGDPSVYKYAQSQRLQTHID
ncbi:hypothetical protein YC2023_080156 [Brassica napus]